MSLKDIREWLPIFAKQYLQINLRVKYEDDPSFINIETRIGSITIIYGDKFICYIDPNKALELYKTSSFKNEHDVCQQYTRVMRKSCKVMTLPFDANLTFDNIAAIVLMRMKMSGSFLKERRLTDYDFATLQNFVDMLDFEKVEGIINQCSRAGVGCLQQNLVPEKKLVGEKTNFFVDGVGNASKFFFNPKPLPTGIEREAVAKWYSTASELNTLVDELGV